MNHAGMAGCRPLRANLAAVAAALLATGCASGATVTQPASSLDGLGERVLQAYIRPATQSLHVDAAQMQAAMRSYCAQPASRARREAVDAQLARLVDSWAAVEILRFGPLVEQNRLEQFFYWPDPRGVLQRQMRSTLAAADATVLDGAHLRAQSVAVQGLPALEYALHADEGPEVIAAGEAAGRFRCAFAGAVAANLERLAGEIEAGWSASSHLAGELAHPAPDHAVYRSDSEVATEVLKALSTALHMARDQKLQPALGEDATAARPSLLPLFRSGLSTRYLAALTASMSRLHAAARFTEALPADARWIDTGLRDELQRVQQDFAALEVPMDRALADAERRDLLVHAALLLANARAMVDEYLAPALGVNLGFNALDGD